MVASSSAIASESSSAKTVTPEVVTATATVRAAVVVFLTNSFLMFS
jgi:hypothetical protein